MALIHANLVKLYKLTEDASLVLNIKRSLKMEKNVMMLVNLKKPETRTLNFMIVKMENV